MALQGLKRRIYIIGVLAPVFFFIAATIIAALLIFRFDGHMMLIWLYATLIATSIVVPPAALFLFSRTRKALKVLGQVEEEGARDTVSDPASQLKAIDSYPMAMASTVIIAASVAVVMEAGFFYFLGDYNGGLSIVYIIACLGFAIFDAYMEFYLLYGMIEPVRKVAYARYWRPGYRGGANLRSRIGNLGMIMSLVILIVGWSVAVTNTVFNSQSNMLERGRENVALMAGETESRESSGTRRAYEEVARAFAFSADGMVVLVDDEGQGIDEVRLGEGVDEEAADELLRKLRESGDSSVLNESMTLGAAGAPIGDTGYTLVQVFPLGSFTGDVGSLTWFYLFLAAAAMLAAFSLTRMTLRSVSLPIEEMREAAEAVSEGDLTARVEMSSSDEIGQLAAAFSSMLGGVLNW
jgi:HAMP domain-containing protein